jgi:hypothetical protein
MCRPSWRTVALVASIILATVLLGGCRLGGEVASPEQETSEAVASQGATAGPHPVTTLAASEGATESFNPSPPSETVKLVFIHHSCGENWLADDDGGLGIALRNNNYFVSDTNYGWGPESIGDRTDITDWPEWFRGPNSSTYLQALYAEFGDHSGRYTRGTDPDPGRENEVILFKSCYPNSNLEGSPNDPPAPGEGWTVSNAKHIYNDLLQYFGTRPDKLFVVITAPPVTDDESSAPPANARAFNNWLVNDWLDGYAHHNVAVFDFYNVLTSNGGDEASNDLGQEDGNHHRWWNGAVQHIQTVDNDLAAYPSEDSHPSQAGNQKATAEFVPLLNVFYNRWHGAPGVAVAPTQSAQPTSPAPGAVETVAPGTQSLAFQDGSSPDSAYSQTDALILANDVEPNANLGAADHIEVFYGEAEYRRSLLRWDLSALPEDVTIASARLDLYRFDGEAPSPMEVGLYRVTSDWREGSGIEFWPEVSEVPDGATWSEAAPGVPWQAPGGDFDSTTDYGHGPNGIVDQVLFPAEMGNGWIFLDVTRIVRAWVEEGVPNYGLLLRPFSGEYTYHYFCSDDAEDPTLRPRLVVAFAGGEGTSLAATPMPVTAAVVTTEVRLGRIEPSDLIYRGAFAYPPEDPWAYSGHALAFYPDGNPGGQADGFPGSLYAAGSASDDVDLVGEISIPQPVITSDFEALPQATVLQPLADITGGWKDNCTYAAGCIYRNVDGLEYLPNVDKIVWNLRDWYNTAGDDQDSLGWSNLDMTGAQGVWHIGDRPSDNDLFHNAKSCNYLFKAPQSFADQNMGGKWLIAGNHREAGALGGSQGPTLYALAPWEDGDPPASGQNLDALPLLYYPEVYECVWEGEHNIREQPAEGVCLFPGYRAMDQWTGGAWVQTADKSGILIFGRKGLGDNCYGPPEECGGDPCNPYQGYHAYPYEPQILFYDPEDLRQVLAGSREPWEVLPYAVHTVKEVFNAQCATLGAAAYDPERGLIYVTEMEAGPWGETAVHVWEVQ